MKVEVLRSEFIFHAKNPKSLITIEHLNKDHTKISIKTKRDLPWLSHRKYFCETKLLFWWQWHKVPL